jgi:hypothetical protein
MRIFGLDALDYFRERNDRLSFRRSQRHADSIAARIAMYRSIASLILDIRAP